MSTAPHLPEAYQALPTLQLIEQRSSTRAFDRTQAITDDQRAAVLHAATRAPSAGAMMLYAVIDIREQTTLDRLAVLCDHQPFIAQAPWALVFVADYAKWMDLFAEVGCGAPEGNNAERVGAGCGNESASDVDEADTTDHEQQGIRPPARGELAIAVQDAVIAAQTAALAAEAVGLGSCYIGDIVERAEDVADLLDLPPYTLPISMLVLGTPAKERSATPHPTENLIMSEHYRPADAATRQAQVAEMDALFRPHATERGSRVRDIYSRKHMSDFMAEMDRSLELWYRNWTGDASRRPN